MDSDELPGRRNTERPAGAHPHPYPGDLPSLSHHRPDRQPRLRQRQRSAFWSAPGGNGSTGTAASYQVRYATQPIANQASLGGSHTG